MLDLLRQGATLMSWLTVKSMLEPGVGHATPTNVQHLHVMQPFEVDQIGIRRAREVA